MLALVRQILLWIEELQTFNMVFRYWFTAPCPIACLLSSFGFTFYSFSQSISGDGVLPLIPPSPSPSPSPFPATMLWAAPTNSQSNWPVAKNASAILAGEWVDEFRCLNNSMFCGFCSVCCNYGGRGEKQGDVIKTERLIFDMVHLPWVGPMQHLGHNSQL